MKQTVLTLSITYAKSGSKNNFRRNAIGKKIIIHDSNLTINAKTHYGLVGQNGCGKTTLLKYIENNLNFDQLILECWDGIDPNSGWVHVSYVNDVANRKDVLTYTRENGYTKGII